MNQPAPRELCEVLQKMECKSESGLFWEDRIELIQDEDGVRVANVAPMKFFQNYFTGATAQADENCKKVWGLEIYSDSSPAWYLRKNLMTQCHTLHNELWHEYLKRTMRGE